MTIESKKEKENAKKEHIKPCAIIQNCSSPVGFTVLLELNPLN